MKKKTTALLTVLLCVVLGAAALLLFLGRGGPGAGAEDGAQVHTVRLESNGAPGPTPRGTADAGPDVPARTEPAEPAYFADAAFVGSGTVTALGMYDYDGILRDADFLETESLADTEAYLEELTAGGYGKVYLGLGPEELTRNSETLLRAVGDTVRALRAEDPAVLVYLMSVTPVSEYRSASDKLTTRERALALNDALLALAREEGTYYLDVFSVLADDEGYLPGDVTEDGMSFTPAHYRAWFELLETHYIDPAGDAAAEEKEGTKR